MLLNKKFLISLIILTSLSNTVFADQAIHLNLNDKAPFSGYLLPDDTAKTLYNAVLERDSYKEQLDLTVKNYDLQKQETGLLLDQNTRLIKSASEDHTLSTLEKILYFSAGIIITGLAVKGAHELYK